MKFLDDRKSERFDVSDGEVSVRILFTRSHDLQEMKSRVVDVGLGGISLAPGVEVEEGALADLKIRLGGITIAETLGLVRWCDPDKGVGIEFFYGSDDDRGKIEKHIRGWAAEYGARSKAKDET